MINYTCLYIKVYYLLFHFVCKTLGMHQKAWFSLISLDIYWRLQSNSEIGHLIPVPCIGVLEAQNTFVWHSA